MNRTAHALLLVLPASLVPAFFACGGENGNLPPPPPPLQATTVATSSAAPDAGAPTAQVEDAGGADTAPSAPAPTLAQGAASPDPPAPLPTVRFVTPLKGSVIAAAKSADYEIKLDVKNWQTAMGSQHVHLILDNTPYKALYDTKKPIKLRELPNGDKLAEGQHVLVAFPSRPSHESVKTAGALAITEFYVGKKTPPLVDISKPFLIYSRPKGEYKGSMASHLLVDFYLANTTLDASKAVTIAISGPGIDGQLTAKADKWGAPFYLDNGQTGTYTLKLQLVDGSGNVIAPESWDSTTRQVVLDPSASDDGSMGGMHGVADGGLPH